MDADKMPSAGQTLPPESGCLCVLYAACDAAAGAKVIQAYRAMGHAVWADTSPSSDTVWTDETQNAIAGCRAAVLLYSHAAYDSALFWRYLRFVLLLGKPRLILHLEEGRHPLLGRQPLTVERWVDPADDLAEEIGRIGVPAVWMTAPEKADSRAGGDLGVTFSPWNAPFRDDVTVNLRTHEAWDAAHRPIEPVGCEALTRLRQNCSQQYLLLPHSYAADYRESEVDRAFFRRQAQAETEKEQAAKEQAARREEQRKKEESTGHSAFPEDYPYMDEFEYLDSQGDLNKEGS